MLKISLIVGFACHYCFLEGHAATLMLADVLSVKNWLLHNSGPVASSHVRNNRYCDEHTNLICDMGAS